MKEIKFFYIRWRKESENWLGVLGTDVWMLNQDDEFLYCKVCSGRNKIELEKEITKYLRLQVDLAKFYDEWCVADENFDQIARQFEGIRMLDQDPVENTFSFICSSNNNIPR